MWRRIAFQRTFSCINNLYYCTSISRRQISALKTSSEAIPCELLKHRNLLKISGPDTSSFLQGLVTNDVTYLDGLQKLNVSSSCFYAMLLNTYGRVLYDILLYKVAEQEYLLEYDSAAKQYIQKHLEMFRLRKKVDIMSVNDMNVWVILPYNYDAADCKETENSAFIEHFEHKMGVTAVVKDPRVPQLGFRILLSNKKDLNTCFPDVPLKTTTDDFYCVLRYKLGIGEGVMDHPPGNCFPFECNVDYLHGVNFQKGCYIGQELTARVHHTGVVRKRLMPVSFSSTSGAQDLPSDSTIVNEKEMKMGKLRSTFGQYGLAVLKVQETLKSKSLFLKGKSEVTVAKPSWWPQEDSKSTDPS